MDLSQRLPPRAVATLGLHQDALHQDGLFQDGLFQDAPLPPMDLRAHLQGLQGLQGPQAGSWGQLLQAQHDARASLTRAPVEPYGLPQLQPRHLQPRQMQAPAAPQWSPALRHRDLLHHHHLHQLQQQKHAYSAYQRAMQGPLVPELARPRRRSLQHQQQYLQQQRENLQQQRENRHQLRQFERLQQLVCQQHLQQQHQENIQQLLQLERLQQPPPPPQRLPQQQPLHVAAAPPMPMKPFVSLRSAFHKVGCAVPASAVAADPWSPGSLVAHPLSPPLPPPPLLTPPPPQPSPHLVLIEKLHIDYWNTVKNEMLPGPSTLSGREFTHLSKEVSLPESDGNSCNSLNFTLPPATENELPIKKRKPRVPATVKDCEIGHSFVKVEGTNCGKALFSLPRFFCELTTSSSQCYKCKQMRTLEAMPGPSGNFRSWNSVFVQQWLYRKLKSKHPELPLNVVCCLLQKLEGKNGLTLSIYTKKQLQASFDNIEGHKEVFALICDKLNEESLCNSSDNRSRESESNISNESPASQQTRINKPRRRRDKCVGQLWEFIYSLLENKETNPSVVTWESKDDRLFRIVNTEEIARRWGDHKGNKKMTYANMSRTMRYYREGNGAFVRNDRKRVYGFGPKADFKRLQMKLSKKKGM